MVINKDFKEFLQFLNDHKVAEDFQRPDMVIQLGYPPEGSA